MCISFSCCIFSLFIFFQFLKGAEIIHIKIFDWIVSGHLNVSWSIYVDSLTAVMLVVVNLISALVHIYSIGYMDNDEHKPRFMAYLSLFTFAMLALVSADNFIQLYFGWEGVGLTSYLLIGFWYKRERANAAAMKAFIVNRVGDFGLAIAIFVIFFYFGSLNYETVFSNLYQYETVDIAFLGLNVNLLELICFLIFIGAMGKSAQFFLHTWLPDAMEGPTPVSALIHAATMVTAGVFLVVKMSPIFEYAPNAMMFVTIIGATTAFFAATVGLVQNDIKRVIAYSTCSQLGYMFFAAGVGAYGAAIFHLFTHAFFKALLFLGAGSVIHALHHEQDMRKMGGLVKMMPLTWVMMLLGTLSLTGFPLLSGFYSKDIIIESAYLSNFEMSHFAFIIGLTVVFLTSFYSWRLFFLTFHGQPRMEGKLFSQVKESKLIMIIPLFFLSLGACFVGYFFKEYFVGAESNFFWKNSLIIHHHTEHPPLFILILPSVAMFLGLLLSVYFYLFGNDIADRLAKMNRPLYLFLLNKWYFDEIYEFFIVKPVKSLGRKLWIVGDGKIIDGFGPDGVGKAILVVTRRAVKFQSGYLYHYAFVMLIGLVTLITYLMFLF